MPKNMFFHQIFIAIKRRTSQGLYDLPQMCLTRHKRFTSTDITTHLDSRENQIQPSHSPIPNQRKTKRKQWNPGNWLLYSPPLSPNSSYFSSSSSLPPLHSPYLQIPIPIPTSIPIPMQKFSLSSTTCSPRKESPPPSHSSRFPGNASEPICQNQILDRPMRNKTPNSDIDSA